MQTVKEWPPEVRARAIEMSRLHGMAEAARLLNVPRSTLRDWVYRANGRFEEAQEEDRAQFMRDAAARLAERDARNARLPNFNIAYDYLGDPPPGRSALDQKRGPRHVLH
ncbi:helix-turn-helix domain-containing protein [Enterovirga aerilata]|uniref:Transposase n=1 Tax=Enterovirga aerilata TaxID=2730920 RepID=A0A849I5N3_9HYPH|nr:helix-turn-helix domain-containing protein [Enterovirga sp. DB1703]NNM74772.1 transposase [Enterovirga sp. DB1703]